MLNAATVREARARLAMEGRTLLKGCSIFRGDGRVRTGISVLIEGHLISKVAPEAELVALPGDWVIECRGRLLRPGLVDCHSHLVNGLLSPVSGSDALTGYVHRFEQRLNQARALTAAEVEALTAHALVQGLRRGVTMHVEHLLAPDTVDASLEAQAKTATRLGARLLFSHASTGFLGDTAGLAQIEANAACAERWRQHSLVRGAMGFSDSFNIGDALLQRVAHHAGALAVGAHFHLCEADDDYTLTHGNLGIAVVERLSNFGLLKPGSVAAFARRLSHAEAEVLATSGTLVALAPLSGALEGERDETLEWLLAQNALVGLASAGLGTVFEAMPLAFAACAREGRAGRLLEPDAAFAGLVWANPAELCAAAFQVPCGVVEPGSLADLALCDLVPAVADEGGQGLHLALQLLSAPVAWTLVNGRVVVREGQLLGADSTELAQDAARAQAALWRRAN